MEDGATSGAREGRSLPWFRVDVDVVDHPRTHALAEELNEPLAGWYVIRLWAWTMRYAARGRLADGARTALERSCQWRGQPGALWAALVKVGWLDELPDGDAEVHDWDEHQGAAVAKAEKDSKRKAERRAQQRARRGDGAETARAGSAVAAGNGTERNGTEEEDLRLSPPAVPGPRPSRKPKPDKAPGDPSRVKGLTEALCADFEAALGAKYGFNGAKDGAALAWLVSQGTDEDIRERWRRGLGVEADKWLAVRTLAQLRQKWNELANVLPLGKGRIEPAERYTQATGPVVGRRLEGY